MIAISVRGSVKDSVRFAEVLLPFQQSRRDLQLELGELRFKWGYCVGLRERRVGIAITFEIATDP